MMFLLRAPETKPVPIGSPMIFLAGPIQDAPEWHDEAIGILGNLLAKKPVHVVVACPKRGGKRKPLDDKDYKLQVAWEVQYLRSAAVYGTALFWLPKAATKSDRPYAQTSRFELGEMFCSNLFSRLNLVVGMEKGFPNERYLRERLSRVAGIYGQTFHPDTQIKIWPTLEATCGAVVRRLNQYMGDKE